MGKFQFSLQRVLDIRQLEEKIAQRKMSEAIDSHTAEQKLLLHFKSEQNRAKQMIETLTKNVVTAGTANLINQSFAGHFTKVEHQQQKVDDAVAQINDQRKQLLTAAKRRKILEKLRDYKYTSYEKATQRQEQKQIDETANIHRFNKKS